MDKIRQPSLCAYMANLKEDPHKIYQIIEKIGKPKFLFSSLFFLFLPHFNFYLGEGSYATVYKALNKITDRLVAVKVFPAHNDQFAYLNEIDFLRKIDHPYMVKLHDVYKTSDEIWMILDYCQLGSIQDLMNTTGKSLTEPEIACVCYSVLHALDYIHMQNKIHRDLKSANILMNSLGQVKLTDFGICSKEASANSFIGSLLWMAPEMIQCNTYDSSVDIWALGICIIEMAEGNAPFHHLHMVRAKYAIQKRPQTYFSDPSKYSEEIKDFLNKCLQMKPENRPKASELIMREFIEKYKPNLADIRKVLCQERIKKLEEFRKNKLIQKSNQAEGAQILNDINEEDDKKEQSERKSHIGNDTSQDNQTFIEKSSREIVEERSQFYSKRNMAENGNKPESQLHYAIKQIKEEEYENSTNHNSPCKRVYEDQLMPEVIVFSSPLKPRSTVSSHNNTLQSIQDIKQADELHEPIVEAESFCQVSAIDRSIEETRMKRKPEDDLEVSFSVAGETSDKEEISIVPKIKMYKATNESNFRVKHKGATKVVTKNVELNESLDGESVLIPVSVDREKAAEMEKMHDYVSSDIVKQILFEFNGMKRNQNNNNNAYKLNEPSTATTQSKGNSNGSSSYLKPSQTPNTFVNVGIARENNESMDEKKYELEEERARLQREMKREMEEIQKRYVQKMNNLEKVGKF